MGGDEPFLGPLALFGGIGLATGVLVTAGVTLFVFRDMSSTAVSAATPTARPAGITLLREFGGPFGTPTPALGVAPGPQASGTRPPLGSALATLAEQEAAQRPASDAPAPAAAEPAPPAARTEPARPAPASQLAPSNAPPATYFDPPPPPRPTATTQPAPTDVPRPTPTAEEDLRAAREPGPVSAPRLPNPTPTPARATPPVGSQPTVTRATPPIVPAAPAGPAGGALATPSTSGSSGSGGSPQITAAITTPTRTTR